MGYEEENEKEKGRIARESYEQYLEDGLSMFPPFKGYGLKLVQFAIDEPDLYKTLFWKDSELSYKAFLDDKIDWARVVPMIMQTFDLNENDARWLFKQMWFYGQGMAAVSVACSSAMTEEEIVANLGGVCRGLVMQLKAPKDERVSLMPGVGKEAPGNIEDYLKGKKNVIVGYGQQKEMYQIRLDAILYFEAVGENVFAYTRGNVYEIRMRLYQVEEHVSKHRFIRASKSMIVNMARIASVAADGSGRGRVVMVNGETVIASRSYYKSLVEAIKSEAEQ